MKKKLNKYIQPRKYSLSETIIKFLILFVIAGFTIFYIYDTYLRIKTPIENIFISYYPKIDYEKYSQTNPIPIPSPKPNEIALKVPVLMYHYISISPWKTDKIRIGLSTPPYIFEEQLKLLQQNGFTTITLDDMVNVFAGKSSLPKNPVILTFDDGYEDFYQNAFPLLQKYNMKGTVFVITSLVGKYNYLTWPQIVEMGLTDNVVFGAHTMHHYSLPSLNPTEMYDEIVTSKVELEKHLGTLINWFAYPYGGYDQKVIENVKKAGFIGAVNTLPGQLQYESRLFYVTRDRAGTKLGEDFLRLVK